MVVIDSSVWIDHFRNTITEQVRLLRLLEPDQILIGDLVLLELLQGARDEHHAARLKSLLSEFETVSMTDPALAVTAAGNFRDLRARGITVRRTIDLIIATFCIERGYALLQSDRDFRPFSQHLGLKLVEP